MTDQINLRQRIEAAWTLESSFTPDKWRSDNPAIGQCGVTALVVRDTIGGFLREGWLDEEKTVRHFFNVKDNVVIDFTWQQFAPKTKLYHIGKIRVEDILANDWFVERYQNFLDNIKNQL